MSGYIMPDGTKWFELPSSVTDPQTGKTWYADLEATAKHIKELKKNGAKALSSQPHKGE